MKIFLAGENGKSKIIPIVHGGGGFPDEVNNENLFSKSTYNTEIPRRATNGDYPIFGGMFDEVKNENIHSRHSSMWGG